MFTGIIESQAILREKERLLRQTRLTFEVFTRRPNFRIGESVAVDGVCVTITAFRGKKFSVDLIPETLRSTSFKGLRIGQKVNFERALRVGDRLGGHWVSGHVDGVGRIRKIVHRHGNFLFQIEAPSSLLRQLVTKGSVAVDGISFTVQEIKERYFVIGVIPHTYRVTTLQSKKEGDFVNLEIDFFAKLVQHFFSGGRSFALRAKDLHLPGSSFASPDANS